MLLIIFLLYYQSIIKIENPDFKVHNAGDFVSLSLEAGKISFSKPGEPDIPWQIIQIPLLPEENADVELKIISKGELKIRKNVIPFPYFKEDPLLKKYRIDENSYKRYPENNLKNLGPGSLRGRKLLLLAYTPFIVENGKLFVIDNAEILIRKKKESRKQFLRKLEDYKIFDKKLKTKGSYILSGESYIDFFERPFWIRIKTTQEGIYCITYDDLKMLGIEPSIYSVNGYGLFSLLGERLTTSRDSLSLLNPLPHFVPILFKDSDNDGYFTYQDTLIFYSPGSKRRKWDGEMFSIEENPFTDTVVFWLALEGGYGVFMDSINGAPTNWHKEKNRCISYIRHEKDIKNPGKRGFKWIGEDLSKFNREYQKSLFYLNLKNITDTLGKLKWSIIHLKGNPDETHIKYILNSDTLANSIYTPPSYNTAYTFTSYPDNLKENNTFEILIGNDGDLVDYLYLDYFEIEYQKFLRAEKDIHAYDTTQGRVLYKIWSNKKGYLFDITDYKNSFLIINHVFQNDTIKFVLENDSIREFYFTKNLKKTPFISIVSSLTKLRDTLNQADYIIITHKDLISGLGNYVSYRKNSLYLDDSLINNANIKVVTVQDIYNEFGFGSPDFVAIRNFLAYTFYFWQNPKPLYVLLAGNGNYDFKNNIGSFKNFVPSSEWGNVLDEYQWGNYTYDIFYVQFDPPPYDPQDMIIGRIPAESASELNNYLKKVMKYESYETNSLWRNRVLGVADDNLENGWEFISEVGGTLDSLPNNMDFKDIYTAFYPYKDGERFECKVKLFREFKKGYFLVFFYGHGSDHQVFNEKILFVPSDVSLLKCNDAPPIFFFGICKPSYFNKTDRSLGEELMINQNSGIATIGSSTLVGAGTYKPILDDFLKVLFDYKIHTIGETYLLSEIPRHYILLSDPTLILQLPEPSINLSFQSELVDTLMKGGKGEFTDTIDGEGKIYLELYGQPGKRTGTTFPPIVQTDTFYTRPDDIFRGKFTLSNGIYNAVFPVAKTLDSLDRFGKILVYYPGKGKGLVGSVDSIYFTEFDSSVVDTTAPIITIFYRGEEIKDSITLSKGSEIEIVIEDENGILIYGSERIILSIAGNLYDMTDYYISDESNPKRGRFRWIIPEDIDPGHYILSVTCYDNFGNPATKTKVINVAEEIKGAIRCLPYPNPSKGKVYFGIDVTISGKADLGIYTLRGRLVYEKKEIYLQDGFNKILWDGKDRDGNYTGNGIYLYRIKFESFDKSFKKTIKGKITILR